MATFKSQALKDWGGTNVHPVQLPCGISPENKSAILDLVESSIRKTMYGVNERDWIGAALGLEEDTIDGKTRKQRIDRLLYTCYHKCKLNASEEKELAVILSRVGAESGKVEETFNVHLARRIWWARGSFGDDDSCFWGMHSDHRHYINENSKDFMALTVYWPSGSKGDPVFAQGDVAVTLKLKDGVLGHSRALIFIDSERPNTFCVTNIYGMNHKKAGNLLAAMFPSHKYACNKVLEFFTAKFLWINIGGFTFWPKDEEQPKLIKARL